MNTATCPSCRLRDATPGRADGLCSECFAAGDPCNEPARYFVQRYVRGRDVEVGDELVSEGPGAVAEEGDDVLLIVLYDDKGNCADDGTVEPDGLYLVQRAL